MENVIVIQNTCQQLKKYIELYSELYGSWLCMLWQPTKKLLLDMI